MEKFWRSHCVLDGANTTPWVAEEAQPAADERGFIKPLIFSIFLWHFFHFSPNCSSWANIDRLRTFLKSQLIIQKNAQKQTLATPRLPSISPFLLTIHISLSTSLVIAMRFPHPLSSPILSLALFALRFNTLTFISSTQVRIMGEAFFLCMRSRSGALSISHITLNMRPDFHSPLTYRRTQKHLVLETISECSTSRRREPWGVSWKANGGSLLGSACLEWHEIIEHRQNFSLD